MTKKHHFLSLSIGLLFGSSILLNSVSAANIPAGTALAEKQEMVRGNGAETPSIDPHKVSGVREGRII